MILKEIEMSQETSPLQETSQPEMSQKISPKISPNNNWVKPLFEGIEQTPIIPALLSFLCLPGLGHMCIFAFLILY